MIALLKRRADVTPQDYRRHYEEVHAPLILRLFPMIADYRRNHVDLAGAFTFPDAAPIDFDTISEFRFADEAANAAFYAAAADPAIMAEVQADEAHFIDSGYTRMFTVHEGTGPTAPTP